MIFCLAVFLSAAPPPSFVVLIADDLGYGEIAPGADAREIPTPNIDRIDGTIFTRGYVTAPNCSPSRAGFLSGRFPTRFGYEFNPVGERNEQVGIGLPPAIQTLPERLQDAGYATALLGKWHLGGTAPYHPHRHGFDGFFGFLHEGHYFAPAPYAGLTTWLRRRTLPPGLVAGPGADRWRSPDGTTVWSTHLGHSEPDYDANNPILRDGQPIVEEEYFTRALTREAIATIDRFAEQPFFLEVAYSAVHSPMQAPSEVVDSFAGIEDIQRRIFAGMLAELDGSVGQILDHLDATGVAERTVVMFFSDNGGPTRELTSSNRPLRGGKMDMYEGGIRVPMRVRWPAKAQPDWLRSSCDLPVSSLDLASTIHALAGGRPLPSDDGIDLTRSNAEQALDERPLFWRQGSRAALVQGSLKIVRNRRVRAEPTSWEFYDLDRDPSEQFNLETEPAAAERFRPLVDRWERLNGEMQPPLFGLR